jgi:hypothetical protein
MNLDSFKCILDFKERNKMSQRTTFMASPSSVQTTLTLLLKPKTYQDLRTNSMILRKANTSRSKGNHLVRVTIATTNGLNKHSRELSLLASRQKIASRLRTSFTPKVAQQVKVQRSLKCTKGRTVTITLASNAWESTTGTQTLLFKENQLHTALALASNGYLTVLRRLSTMNALKTPILKQWLLRKLLRMLKPLQQTS